MSADDITRHRRPGQSLPGRFGVGVLVLAALAVGGVINSRAPDTDHRERPFVATGRVGSPVNVRTFEATVLGVRGTTKLARSGKWHTTGGIWVLVRLRLVARSEPTQVGYAAVRDAKDRTYLATTRIEQPLQSRSLQPGIPVEGEIAFEVPPAAAPTLSVRLAEPLVDTRMEAMAEVPLDITRSKVDQWRTDQDIMKIADTEAV
jgi:hypothetical protein